MTENTASSWIPRPDRELQQAEERRLVCIQQLESATADEQAAKDKLAELMNQASSALASKSAKPTNQKLQEAQTRIQNVERKRAICQEALDIINEEVKELNQKVVNRKRKAFNREMRGAVDELHSALLDVSRKNEKVMRIFQQAQDEIPGKHDLFIAHMPDMLYMHGYNSKLKDWINRVAVQHNVGNGQDAHNTPEGVNYDRKENDRTTTAGYDQRHAENRCVVTG
mgnify:CR=1 FL=1